MTAENIANVVYEILEAELRPLERRLQAVCVAVEEVKADLTTRLSRLERPAERKSQ